MSSLQVRAVRIESDQSGVDLNVDKQQVGGSLLILNRKLRLYCRLIETLDVVAIEQSVLNNSDSFSHSGKAVKLFLLLFCSNPCYNLVVVKSVGDDIVCTRVVNLFDYKERTCVAPSSQDPDRLCFVSEVGGSKNLWVDLQSADVGHRRGG